MSNQPNQQINPSKDLVYQIRVKGHLGHQWTEWLESVTITLEADGSTLLTSPPIDQAALYGLLRKVRDIGLPLVSVTAVRPHQIKGDLIMKQNNFLIEADELLTKIDDPNIRIYDATILFFREASGPTAHDEYLEAHIPGAAFFDHQDFSDASSNYMYMILPEADLAKQIGNIGIGEESEVIFYTTEILACATRAWWVLRYAGHNNVRVLMAG